METMPYRQIYRAIDVAGGDGRLSDSFLQMQYKRVDLFDGCPLAVQRATETMNKYKNFGYAEVAMMQEFRWHY